MKTVHKLALALTALLAAGVGHAQTTVNAPGTSLSRSDNPGILGHTYADLNYSWVDFSRDRGVDADGFIAGFHGNTPVSPGIDFGLGYNYYRENGHRNPFTGTDYDARYHQLNTNSVVYTRSSGLKPFLSGGIGYQWSQGDIQRLRTFDNMWLWNAGVGAEIPLGTFALTPRANYSDGFDSNAIGVWHYGGQVHKWLNDQAGVYIDVAFHDPRRDLRAQAWTYTAGLRFRF